MPLDRQQMIEHAEVVRLARLGHEVRHENPDGRRPLDRFGRRLHEQRRQQARIEAARADDDYVGTLDGVHDTRRTARRVRQERETRDPSAGARDRRFAVEHAAVRELRDERHQLGRRRQHNAPRADDARGDLHRLGEVVRHVRERGQHEIADRMTVEPIARSEAVLKDVRDPRVVVRERRETVPDIAGRNHVELRTQPSRAAAVVRRRDDRDQALALVAVRLGASLGRAVREQHAAEAPQHVRESRAAADRDDARARRRAGVGPDHRGLRGGARQHHAPHLASKSTGTHARVPCAARS